MIDNELHFSCSNHVMLIFRLHSRAHKNGEAYCISISSTLPKTANNG